MERKRQCRSQLGPPFPDVTIDIGCYLCILSTSQHATQSVQSTNSVSHWPSIQSCHAQQYDAATRLSHILHGLQQSYLSALALAVPWATADCPTNNVSSRLLRHSSKQCHDTRRILRNATAGPSPLSTTTVQYGSGRPPRINTNS